MQTRASPAHQTDLSFVLIIAEDRLHSLLDRVSGKAATVTLHAVDQLKFGISRVRRIGGIAIAADRSGVGTRQIMVRFSPYVDCPRVDRL